MSERHLTIQEASAESGVSVRSIREGCKNGTITYVRCGDGTERVHKRIPQSQVDALREARTVRARPADPAPQDEVSAVLAAIRVEARRQIRRRDAA